MIRKVLKGVYDLWVIWNNHLQMTSYPLNKSAFHLLIWTVLAGMMLLMYTAYCRTLPIWEDAFISFRYAHNWAGGRGLVYNPGEIVEGYTNFLWVALIALGSLFGIPPWAFARIVGFASLIGILISILLFYRKNYPEKYLAGVTACSFIVLNQQVVRWAGSGLETGLVTALVIAAALAGFTSRDHRYPVIPAVLWSLAILTRPDSVIWLFAVSFALFLEKKHHAGILRMLAMIGFFLLPYVIWRHMYFGMWFPATYHTRMGYTSAQLVRGFLFLKGYLNGHWMIFLGLLTISDWFKPGKSYLRACGFGIIAHLLYVVAVGGDWMEFRFFSIITPPAMILNAELIWKIAELARTQRTVSRRVLMRISCGIILILLSTMSIRCHIPQLFSHKPLHLILDHRTNRTSVGELLGLFIRDHGYADEWLVTHYAEVAFASEMKVYNPFGLTSIDTALLEVDTMGHGRVAHEKVNWAGGLEKNPIFIFPDYASPDYTALKTPTADGGFSRFSIRKDIQDQFLPWWETHFHLVPSRKE